MHPKAGLLAAAQPAEPASPTETHALWPQTRHTPSYTVTI
jgi:hypothetical protein